VGGLFVGGGVAHAEHENGTTGDGAGRGNGADDAS
jgi:hypothetical protein